MRRSTLIRAPPEFKDLLKSWSEKAKRSGLELSQVKILKRLTMDLKDYDFVHDVGFVKKRWK